MSHPNRGRAVDGRARAHIKALIDEAKHQTANSPMPAQMFFAGMLSGLGAAMEVIDGGTAEGSMETIVQKMSAAVGQAYLDGSLPPQPPTPDEPDTLRARAEQAEAGRIAADNMLRAVCDVFGGPHQDPIVKARETLARAEQAEATVQLVIDVYERWVKAGPPKLGTSIARSWDARLAELHAAIHGPGDQQGCHCHNGDELCSGCRRCPDVCNGCDGPVSRLGSPS